LSDFNQNSQQIFAKFSNTKFHENPSSGIRVVPRCDMTNLIVAFHNFKKPVAQPERKPRSVQPLDRTDSVDDVL